MLLDIKTSHPKIRVEAKKSNCEQELDNLKDDLILHLMYIRSKITS
jgi:hypothetical protein